MRSLALAAALVGALTGNAFAWGQEGHSIIAEIAQQRLSEPAARMVATLLKGRSLVSIVVLNVLRSRPGPHPKSSSTKGASVSMDCSSAVMFWLTS